MDPLAVDPSSGSSLYGLAVPVVPLCPGFEEDQISLAKTTRFSSPYPCGRAIRRNRIASMCARDAFSGLHPKWCLSFVCHSGIHRDGAALALFSRDSCDSPFVNAPCPKATKNPRIFYTCNHITRLYGYRSGHRTVRLVFVARARTCLWLTAEVLQGLFRWT